MKSKKNREGKPSTSGKAGVSAPGGAKNKFTVDERKLEKITGGAAAGQKPSNGKLAAN